MISWLVFVSKVEIVAIRQSHTLTHKCVASIPIDRVLELALDNLKPRAPPTFRAREKRGLHARYDLSRKLINMRAFDLRDPSLHFVSEESV